MSSCNLGGITAKSCGKCRENFIMTGEWSPDI